jgi:phosphate transport system protein
MQMRSHFNTQLDELRTEVLEMGHMVGGQLTQALEALEHLDTIAAEKIIQQDELINNKRFTLEKRCTALIATQQPAARDVRDIIGVMNMIIDLERMGDQAKGIAKVIPRMSQQQDIPLPVELNNMGYLAHQMLSDSLTAFNSSNVELAHKVAEMDNEMDRLYAAVFKVIIEHLANHRTPEKVESTYEILRTARELERFGDLATNLAERVVYMVTGHIKEMNPEAVRTNLNR